MDLFQLLNREVDKKGIYSLNKEVDKEGEQEKGRRRRRRPGRTRANELPGFLTYTGGNCESPALLGPGLVPAFRFILQGS